MRLHRLLAVFLLVSVVTVNAAYFYTADHAYTRYPNEAPRLYLYDSDTNQLNVIGQVKDEEGNLYRVTALHYFEDSQRLFALASSKESIYGSYEINLIEINPKTGEG